MANQVQMQQVGPTCKVGHTFNSLAVDTFATWPNRPCHTTLHCKLPNFNCSVGLADFRLEWPDLLSSKTCSWIFPAGKWPDLFCPRLSWNVATLSGDSFAWQKLNLQFSADAAWAGQCSMLGWLQICNGHICATKTCNWNPVWSEQPLAVTWGGLTRLLVAFSPSFDRFAIKLDFLTVQCCNILQWPKICFASKTCRCCNLVR